MINQKQKQEKGPLSMLTLMFPLIKCKYSVIDKQFYMDLRAENSLT